MALGSETSTFGVPGAKKLAIPFCTDNGALKVQIICKFVVVARRPFVRALAAIRSRDLQNSYRLVSMLSQGHSIRLQRQWTRR